jgi:ectoine hydroxylase-related dioxygenase (phytanoyl-CoA dioxygenase family)
MNPGMLPDLAAAYEIPAEHIADFQSRGHILLRGIACSEEVAAYRTVILAAREQFGAERTRLEERDTYGKAFLKGMNLWTRDAGVRRFVLASRFARIAADLLAVDGVRIYHDQALLKEPGGGITPWHQDQHYWPLDTDNTVTMWMPLVDVSPAMGAMRFASGSHRDGYLGDAPISDESEQKFEEYIRDRGYTVVPGVDMQAGDATFHYGWTLHGASANATGRTREAMTVIWYADGARVLEPGNVNRQRDLERWMPGLKPGDLAASELNPLVFRRGESHTGAW